MRHQLRAAAQAGRGGDTMLAHLSPGEIVVPASAQSPELRQMLAQALAATGHDPGRYVIGGADDSRNPKTGLREFYDAGDGMGGAETGGDNQGGIGGATGPDFGGGPGPQGGGGQIADFSPQDQQRLGYNQNDLSDTHSVQISAGPNEARIGSWARDTFGRGLGGRVAGWAGDKLGRTLDNPVGSMIDFAVGGFPGLGQINTLSGLAGFPTVGSGITSAGRSIGQAMGFGAPAMMQTQSPTAPQGTQPTNTGNDIRFILARALTGG